MFTKAAEVGHVPSQIQTAKMHANGQGVARNYDNAIYWFNLAAESGNSLYVPQATMEGRIESTTFRSTSQKKIYHRNTIDYYVPKI